MGFGSCCVLSDGRLINMNAKSIKIECFQRGFLVNFGIIQTFTHSENRAKEVYYVFSNDLKICIYDTIFVVGQEIIKPKLQPKEEAKNLTMKPLNLGVLILAMKRRNLNLEMFNLM
ncbi:von Willebrand factor A domain-containing protein 5A [Tritrichomonas musculus]|uniref:von Willebrand factor A domain-containing protein 5A n=1 Tax=Tritrichomonas musculus TaxID=1915356 RepID=A0ABR2HFZ2_9EUKA